MCLANICMLLVSRPVWRPSLSTIVLGRHATGTRTAEQYGRVWGPSLVAVVFCRRSVLAIL
eukprot:14725574-Ditylum_brightwellii.AAC.1